MKIKELNQFKNKKIFLTGHTGFKGTWMLVLLKQLGAIVKGYSLAPKNEGDLYNAINGNDFCESIIADIRNKEKLFKELSNFRPDIIFHFAAQPLVRLSYEIPSETFEVNAIGTANILEIASKMDHPCVIVTITTDKVYENLEWVYPYRENDRIGGFDPYSASKACAEIVISSFRSSFFNSNEYNKHKKSLASARSGNVIGGGDWSKDRIIPDIVNSIQNGKPILVRNAKSVRPWQHVLDPLFGYLLLAEKMISNPIKYADAWNFGPFDDTPITVENLVNISIAKFGKGSYSLQNLSNQPHEAKLLRLDISKAIEYLGWRPIYSGSRAIEITIDWYRKYYEEKISALSLMELDIMNYYDSIK